MTGDETSNGASKTALPRVSVYFDRGERAYGPGEPLGLRYDIEGVAAGAVRAVERSVLWYTEGKGEEDLGVHHFERIEGPARLAQAMPVGSVACELPATPLSYEGIIVKIRWCVRIRIFFASGRDFVSEHVFEVGAIPPVSGVVERLT